MTTIKTQFLKYSIVLFMSVMFFTSTNGIAQNLNIIPQSSSINVHGTSNVHDWDMKPNKIISELGINSSNQINALLVKIDVKSLKSGKSIMDGKTYDAFEYKKNPTITFQLTEVSPAKISNQETEVTLIGNLSMAGQTKKISLKTICKITKTGDYELKGTFPMKMTEFGIEPPTAFFGTMKTE